MGAEPIAKPTRADATMAYLHREQFIELADLVGSYWVSAREAAYRADDLTLKIHCRQIVATTRLALELVKLLNGEAAA
jgi:hypothetical protein